MVFEEAEWKAACTVAAAGKKRGPLREPTLGEFIALVAKFGGHLGRRGDKPPGAQALWQGLSRVRVLACPHVATIPRAGPARLLARTPPSATSAASGWMLMASSHAD